MLVRKSIEIKSEVTIEELFEILRILTLGKMRKTTIASFIGDLVGAGFKGDDKLKDIIEDIREHKDEHEHEHEHKDEEA